MIPASEELPREHCETRAQARHVTSEFYFNAKLDRLQSNVDLTSTVGQAGFCAKTVLRHCWIERGTVPSVSRRVSVMEETRLSPLHERKDGCQLIHV